MIMKRILVFKAKYSEMEWVVKRSTGNFTGDADNDNVVRLRGLPFECSREDIYKFFEGNALYDSFLSHTRVIPHPRRTMRVLFSFSKINLSFKILIFLM